MPSKSFALKFTLVSRLKVYSGLLRPETPKVTRHPSPCVAAESVNTDCFLQLTGKGM